MAEKLKITLVKSTIGAIPKHKKTVEALGLRKLNKTVELPDKRGHQRNDPAGEAPGQGRRSIGGSQMELSNLQPAAGSKHSDNFRRGRGHGSGNGKTAGKGHKGQKARSGAPPSRL